jgi:acetolactate synthase-1/2/3 large subunit
MNQAMTETIADQTPPDIATDTPEAENVAQELLLALGARGVRYLFGNGGTDFASVIDGFARFDGTTAPVPTPMTVPHENVAMSMAHGYYMQTGEPQVVMVHVTVGTANALNGLINASHAHVPLVLFAGRTPLTDTGSPASRNAHIHWPQESFDQASMVREWVKWDYELRDASMVDAVVERAFSIATTEPCGPVYVTLPREVLAEPIHHPGRSRARRTASPVQGPAPEATDAAVSALMRAKSPVIVTAAAGAQRQAVGELIKLAEVLGAPVVESRRYYMNFPTTHPLHLGYNPNPLITESDCVLVVDADVPWIPSQATPPETATVIHIGADPLRSSIPMWQFPVDIAIAARPHAALEALTAGIAARGGLDPATVSERTARWTAGHDEQRVANAAAREDRRSLVPIDFGWIAGCLDDIADENTVFVNEYDLDPRQLELEHPGTFLGFPPAGGLGWGLGAALGAALAAPDKTVIACIGDGSYMFGSPTPAHFVSRCYGLPALFVVFNNERWDAVDDSMRKVHPHGWGAAMKTPPLTSLSPSPDYEMIIQACGGYGERVEDPAELPRALQRALHAVRAEKRQALLNVISSR